MSWSSKKSSRMHSRFFSLDSAGVPSQLLRFWKKKYRAAAHTTAVATMQKSGIRRIFSELRRRTS